MGPERGASRDVTGRRQAPRRRAGLAGRRSCACPVETGVAFVSGATVANASCLAAARDSLLAQAGWDAQADGLFGAPERPGRRSASGPTRRSSKSLGLVGLGRNRVTVVPADDQGRLRADLLPDIDGPVLVCAQAGEVNTGAFDPFDEIADWAAARSGWLHVDGAFGLWALADPARAHLVRGLDRADSWATDGHKWLNVTYDCGIAFVRRLADLRRTFSAVAGYLPAERRVRGHAPHAAVVAASATGRGVGGTADPRATGSSRTWSCGRATAATAIADRLDAGGLTILNDVVLNQVLVRLVDGPTTEAADRRDPGRRPGLVRADAVGRRHGDADQRVVVEDRPRRRRVRRRRHPRLRRPGAQHDGLTSGASDPDAPATRDRSVGVLGRSVTRWARQMAPEHRRSGQTPPTRGGGTEPLRLAPPLG